MGNCESKKTAAVNQSSASYAVSKGQRQSQTPRSKPSNVVTQEHHHPGGAVFPVARSIDPTESDVTTESSVNQIDQDHDVTFHRKKSVDNEDSDGNDTPEARDLKPGYSSGASSECSDDSEHNTSSRGYLKGLKSELATDKGLCTGVVRIEVSRDEKVLRASDMYRRRHLISEYKTDFGRPIDEVYEGVQDGPVLGTGVAGVVRRVKHKKTGVNYAVKCLDLGLIRDNVQGLTALREEISIMCQLDHPNVVRLDEVYESDDEIFLIQELCEGGDLFDRLDDQSEFHYSEAKCARLVKQMVSSIRYLHSKNIVHRDLKLENFLFSSSEADSDLRMIDFGLSKHFTHAGETQYECVGTPYTVAPDILRGQYDEKVDIWSLGVITYLLLCGETPFGGADGECLVSVRQNILRGVVEFAPEDLWRHVSDDGKNFVRRLLNPEAAERPTAREVQLDPWLQNFGKKDGADKSLSPKLAKALVEFKEFSEMRKMLCEVLSFTLLPEQICGLRQEFEKADPEGEGEISLGALKQVLVDTAEAGALGALDETEIEEIFNALRVRKSETKIRWHEFIAAGITQCNFDERNLKLAFDRLDYDRKGFITMDDMKEMLGTSGAEENEAMFRMWQEGMTECSCPMGHVTYDDFRMFVKGQKKDQHPTSPSIRRKYGAGGMSTLDGSLRLDAVPEGAVSPQGKPPVFIGLDESTVFDSIKLPSLIGTVSENCSQPKTIPVEIPLRPTHRRVRSRSLGEKLFASEVLGDDSAEQAEVRRSAFPSKALFRQQRELRLSVLEASKLFDSKRKARKLQLLAQLPLHGTTRVDRRASLVMRHGASGTCEMDRSARHIGKDDIARVEEVKTPPQEEHKQVHDAVRRSGRPRRTRRKTTSDLSGMLK